MTAPRSAARIVPRVGEPRLEVVGLPRSPFSDIYHRALRLRWRSFLALTIAAYIGGNAIFAGLYLLQPGAIDKARPGSFADAFFFSVQTMATIGYGAMAPATLYANLLMTAETLFGMILLAVVTGLIFARFSRPTARMLFSDVAVVMPFQGQPTLMMRVGNRRANQIVQAEVQLAILRDEITLEGERMRRFHDLALVRSRTPVFALTFSIMHVIDASSPIAGCTRETLEACRAEFVLSVTGLDETMSQAVHARCSYLPHEVLFGHRFADIFVTTEAGRQIDFARFHDTEPLAPAATKNGEPADSPLSPVPVEP